MYRCALATEERRAAHFADVHGDLSIGGDTLACVARRFGVGCAAYDCHLARAAAVGTRRRALLAQVDAAEMEAFEQSGGGGNRGGGGSAYSFGGGRGRDKAQAAGSDASTSVHALKIAAESVDSDALAFDATIAMAALRASPLCSHPSSGDANAPFSVYLGANAEAQLLAQLYTSGYSLGTAHSISSVSSRGSAKSAPFSRQPTVSLTAPSAPTLRRIESTAANAAPAFSRRTSLIRSSPALV